jgi:hypothetical protein
MWFSSRSLLDPDPNSTLSGRLFPLAAREAEMVDSGERVGEGCGSESAKYDDEASVFSDDRDPWADVSLLEVAEDCISSRARIIKSSSSSVMWFSKPFKRCSANLVLTWAADSGSPLEFRRIVKRRERLLEVVGMS